MSFLEVKMEQAQQYFDMARQAMEEKAHVARVVYGGLGALLSTSAEESTRAVEALMEYGSIPKKPIDRLATYHLARYIVSVKSLGGTLDTKVQQLIEKTNLEADKNATA